MGIDTRGLTGSVRYDTFLDLPVSLEVHWSASVSDARQQQSVGPFWLDLSLYQLVLLSSD